MPSIFLIHVPYNDGQTITYRPTMEEAEAFVTIYNLNRSMDQAEVTEVPFI